MDRKRWEVVLIVGQLRRGPAALDSAMSAMQGSPVEVDHTTRSGGARWTRGRDRRRLLFLGVRRRGGWRKRGGGELRVWDVLIALGHSGAKQYVGEVRQIT
jgi:hypothetical protein